MAELQEQILQHEAICEDYLNRFAKVKEKETTEWIREFHKRVDNFKAAILIGKILCDVKHDLNDFLAWHSLLENSREHLWEWASHLPN